MFIKFRIGNTGQWQHAWLDESGHIPPSGTIIETGLVRPDTTFNLATNPGMGIFIYRSANGSGSFPSTDSVRLRWNYGAQGISDNAHIEVKVFAVEMVYIPQGSFAVGDSSVSVPPQFTLTTINTGNARTVPSGTGSLGGAAGGFPTGQSTPVSSSWPNGYNAFYCMKYEVSQQQYVDFLNSLNKTQQINRTVSITNLVYAMTGNPPGGPSNFRNGIRCSNLSPSSPGPVSFFCDIIGQNNGGYPNDGRWIACNHLGWLDLESYLDWSGLRPMTELEYEKACRGSLLPVSGEYAWCNPTLSPNPTATTNGGYDYEAFDPPIANANYLSQIGGPLRVGAFATSATSTRQSAGASYYGALDMTGNIYEYVVSIGTATGLSFTGLHGNGSINSAGSYDVANWPDNSLNTGGRGGSWSGGASTVSSRSSATSQSTGRTSTTGGRGVRSAH